MIYLAIRFAAPDLYGESGSAIVLNIVGLVLIMLGTPVAFAMAFGAFAAFAPFAKILLVTISQNMAASLDSFTLLAIPFFILAAAVMNAGGITPRLVDLAVKLVGHLRGGFGQANVITNTMLAGISGSSTADASTIAKLMVPEMAKRGYDRPFSAALTASASTLANMIPPSLGLIIYAALASVSVGALFVATIVPGLLVAASLDADRLRHVATPRLRRRRREGVGRERLVVARHGDPGADPAAHHRHGRPLRRFHRHRGRGHRLRLRDLLRGAALSQADADEPAGSHSRVRLRHGPDRRHHRHRGALSRGCSPTSRCRRRSRSRWKRWWRRRGC